MAKLHNKAGQWGKRRAARKFMWFLYSGMLAIASLSFLAGAFITHRMTYIAFAVFLAGS